MTASSGSLSSVAQTTRRGGQGRSVAERRKHSFPGGNLGNSDYSTTRGSRARCCSAWSLGEIKRRPACLGHSCHAADVGLKRAVSLAGWHSSVGS